MKKIKKKTILILNIFFLSLFVYALWIFKTSLNTFNVKSLIENSILKEKTFKAEIKEITSQNGIKTWLMEENSAPIVVIDFYFDRAGFTFENKDKTGLTMLVAQMLSQGAGKWDRQAYHNLLEENAINIDFEAHDDVFEISMQTPTQNIDIATDVLKAVFQAPHFASKHLEIAKRKQIEAIKVKNEKPQSVLNTAFQKKFYGEHPKARDPLGTKETVQKISTNDLKNFVKEHFVSNKLVVSVAGNISQVKAAELIDDLFANLPNRKNADDLPKLVANYHFEEENIERKMPQVLSVFVAEGTTRLSPDFYPLYIANEIFGGSGLSSRLNLIAREKEGLTYGAYTYLDTQKDAPSIKGGFATSKQNYTRMREILFQEWQKMAEFGVSEDEFQAIKNNMLTSFNLRFTSLSNIASQLLYMQKENLGIDFLQKRNDYVQKVTLDEVNAAAKKYFKNIPSILTIGNN